MFKPIVAVMIIYVLMSSLSSSYHCQAKACIFISMLSSISMLYSSSILLINLCIVVISSSISIR